MDKNTLIGIFVIVIIFFAWSMFFEPNKSTVVNTDENLKEQHNKSDEIITKTKNKEQGNLITLENNTLKLEVSEVGAKPYKVILKNQKRFDGSELRLIDGTNNDNDFNLLLSVNGKRVLTNNLNFFIVDKTDSSLTLRHKFNEEQYVDFNYQLSKSAYKVDFYVSLNGLNSSNQEPIKLNWVNNVIHQEANSDYEKSYTTIYYKASNETPDYLSENADSDSKKINHDSLTWLSFKQRFFSSAIVSENSSFKNLSLEQKSLESKPGSDIIKHMSFSAELPQVDMQHQQYKFWFYFGPNHYQTLEAFNIELEKQIPLGWGPLRWVNRWAVIPFFNWLDNYHLNYGIIIILLTLMVKLILLPLTYSSHVSQVKMQVLKPEIDAIKEKFADKDQHKMQQEFMKLYKSAGVNPFGGCIPLLLQLPIIFALFRFLPSAFELRQKSFLWVDDLSTYDAVIKLGFNIPFIGDHISLMCLLMTLSTLIYTWLNNRISGITGQMKILGYIMPFLFLGILNSFPAGLNLYYFCSNIITFVQQAFIRMFINEESIHNKIQENKKKPAKKAKSMFQKKLEELSKQRQ